jgi:hypothetical protein
MSAEFTDNPGKCVFIQWIYEKWVKSTSFEMVVTH